MFSIISAYTTRTQVDRAQCSASLIETYQRAIAVFRTEETFALEYLLDPRPEKAARLEDAGADLAEAVSEITAQGGQEDAKLARELLALHDRYLVASERLLGAMGAGDQVEARRIDDTESHPVFLEMQYLLTSARLTSDLPITRRPSRSWRSRLDGRSFSRPWSSPSASCCSSCCGGSSSATTARRARHTGRSSSSADYAASSCRSSVTSSVRR